MQMRIVVHGQEAFGKAVLEKLLERKENVVAVCCAPDKAGRPEDPLKLFAIEKGLPVHQPKSWKTPEALELMKSFNADVCMMAYVLLFVPQPVLDRVGRRVDRRQAFLPTVAPVVSQRLQQDRERNRPRRASRKSFRTR